MRIALGQFAVRADWEENLEACRRLVRAAAARGARLLVLPEGVVSQNPDDADCGRRNAQPLDGPFVTGLSAAAAQARVAVCAALLSPLGREDGRAANINVLLDGGRILAAYRKLHLYDAFGGGESARMVAGDALPPVVALEDWRVGLLTCYDLRFPEVARHLALSGAELLLAPAAWVRGPGKAGHWEISVRCRALENTVFVAAANECGPANIGRSMLVDPLGAVLQAAGGDPALIVQDISREAVAAARRALPVLANRRFAAPALRRGT